jgi:biopolymer transport protein ExbD
MAHGKRMGTEQVEPDLPITPMLDMSFQLLAFFIMTFHPAPTEAQIAMALPQQDGGPAANIPDLSSDKPAKYVVRVTAAEPGGTIKSMSLREDGAAGEGKDLGANIQTYLTELKGLVQQAKGKPIKLTLELDEKLLEAYVVQLIDTAIQADISDISPVPADPKKR